MSRPRASSSLSSQKKVRLTLRDVKLVDIPLSSNLLYLRIKQGRRRLDTAKFPIESASVCFGSIVFDYKLQTRSRRLRFSFRLENRSGSGFTRYGVVEVDAMRLLRDRTSAIRVPLSRCSFNSHFVANIDFGDGRTDRRSCELMPFSQTSGGAFSELSRDASSGSSNSDELFEGAPVKIARARFDELESQVDDILADIINSQAW
jgi:hypothetical protein